MINPGALQAIPEPVWRWRRVLTFFLAVTHTALLAIIVHQLNDPASLRHVANLLAALLALVVIVYLIAPSAEYVTALRGLARAIRGDDEPEMRNHALKA